ncbi:MAG: HmuY family protein [Cryomorphaceae bacterium]|nr:HmuY family protein [Cryomorphaceae bacterium]
MKRISLFTLLAATIISCSSDDDNNGGNANTPPAKVYTAEDISSVDGKAYYSLRTQSLVAAEDSATTKWDIAFDGTNIYLNGGVSGPGDAAGQVKATLFDEADEAPENGYIKDKVGLPAISAAAGNTWYIYNDGAGTPPHSIIMTPGRVIFVKTADGQYAKIELLSYYKGNPDTGTQAFANLQTRPPSRYHTFRFAVAADGGRKF